MKNPRNRLAGAPREGADTWDDGEVTQRFGDPAGPAPDPAAADDEATAVLRSPGPVPSPRARAESGGGLTAADEEQTTVLPAQDPPSVEGAHEHSGPGDEETTVLPAQVPGDGEPTAVLAAAGETAEPALEVETAKPDRAEAAVEEQRVPGAPAEAGAATKAGAATGVGAAAEAAAEPGGEQAGQRAVSGDLAEPGPVGADPIGAGPVEADPVEADPALRPPRGRRRAVRERLTRRSAVVALLCAILGFALAAQLRANDAGDARFANLRQSDLVQILDELDSREKRLRSEISDLEFRRQNLTSANQGSENAVADAEKRAAELGILAGTVTAEGPGVVITLKENKDKPLLADRLLDAVQELRGAGAEALQIAGGKGDPVRIVASTYFTDAAGGISVDGHVLAAPYLVTAIGDPQTIDRAMRIPGGVVATIRQDEAQIQIDQRRTVQITAIRAPRAPRFAKPVK